MNSDVKKKFIRAISYLSVACIVLLVSTVVYANKASKYKFSVEIAYERALSELCESLDNITVSLQKGTYCATGKMLSDISNDLSRQASCAKVSLSQLTDKNIRSEEIYKFLSQIGAFTGAVADNGDRLSLTVNQKENMKELLAYSKSLSESLGKIRDGSYKGEIISEKQVDTLTPEEELPGTFSESMSDADQNLADYPTLIYDGPFADNISSKNGGKMLKVLDEITRDEARKKAGEFIGAKPESLREEADVNSQIDLYCFSKGDIGTAITKRGGMLCYMINPRDTGEETISSEEGIKRAKKFLNEAGYASMRDTYYSLYDGVCTVNFAYSKDGIVHYSDLIKVSVALDNGEILSVDARGYLMNHTKRDIYEENFTLEQAREIISDDLQILREASAVIPLYTGKEAYCYEFRCKDKKGQQVLIYIDKATGEEKDILLLLYADGGIMTR
ncbi:MAG: germination protein YpeB [Clostridia bacterium]|nr:germination protein YpeB [Clostridia bacterium]